MDTCVTRPVGTVWIQLIVLLCMELASLDVEQDILEVYAKKVSRFFVKITMLTFENISISFTGERCDPWASCLYVESLF